MPELEKSEGKRRAPRRKRTAKPAVTPTLVVTPAKEKEQLDLHSRSLHDVTAQTVTLAQSAANTVDAKSVTATQSAMANVSATSLTAKQSTFAQVEAERVEVTQGAIALARAEEMHLAGAGAVAILGTNVQVDAGGAQYLVARNSIQVGQGGAAVMAAQKVEIQNGFVGIVLAREFNGNVRTLFDQRGAFVFGLAAGIVLGLLGLSQRKSKRV